MTHRSLSYSRLDKIDTGLQRPRSTPIQFQNGSTERQGEPRTRISPPNHSIPENQTPSAMRTFHQAGENLGIPSETETIQNYIEKNDAELKRIHAIVHMATSSAPDIDMVIEETRRTPFTNIIASVRLHHVGKLKFPEDAGNSDPKAHVRAFRLAISRATSPMTKKAGYCRFFAENLTGAALECLHRDKSYRRRSLKSQTSAFRAIKSIHNQIPRNQSQDLTSERSRCPRGVKEWRLVLIQIQGRTGGQHSYAINNSPQKSSTYDLSKYCAFHDRKGRSTEECRAALCNQNENKKTNEEAREEEEEPVTPKSHQKAKVPTNKRGREIEQESPSSPPPAPKKRVDMISWGQNSNTTDEIKSQTEGKIRFEISVAIRTLENPDEVTPLPVSLHTTQTQSLRT
uniref:Uncharacterized protein n=1 Tax=Brassica oleracea var. oleracea TaxID=109376 RepID=A0A0D3A380_BRAOL